MYDPAMPRIRLDRTWLIALGTATVLFLLHLSQIVNFHELDAVDLRLRLRGPRPADARITVVAIDDKSLAAVGEWPWPRAVHASFLDIISRYHPQAVFLDMLFTEQSPDPEGDKKFSQSIKAAGNVILPFYFVSESPFKANFPIDVLREAAAGTGFVNVNRDPDGRMRRVRMSVKTDKGSFYHPSVVLTANEKSSKGELWINYPGDQNSYRNVSFGDVIAAAGLHHEETLQKLFTGKIVLIGHTATGTSDLIATPFSTQEPGVFIHAGALHTLLSGKILKSLPAAAHFLLLIFLCALPVFIAQRLATLYGLLASIALSVLYAVFNFLMFLFAGWILPLFLPLAGITLSYVLILFMKYLETQMHQEMMQRELESAFDIQQKFLPQVFSYSTSLDVSFECRFTKQVGGDLYDWVDLGGGRVGFCIGDVSGKGMPAAIYMAKALSDFRSLDKHAMQPGEVCRALNQRLISKEQTTMFMTFLYVIVDLERNKISYSSAAHEPMIFFQKKTREAILLKEAQGPPLGAFEESEYSTAEHSFEIGDGFVLLSDGIKELRNPKGEEFGIERLRQVVQGQAPVVPSAKVLLESLFKILQKHQEDTPAHDDRTFLCVLRS